MLYLIATPIGNLKDITLRALETLEQVDGVICEDSRRTSLLLNNFHIKKPLLVLNDYNETAVTPQVLEKLKSGQNLALVSDAGTPLISDPGFKLVRAALEASLVVDSIPGPSSLIVALTLSGLPPDKFLFLGYLPEKSGKRISVLKSFTAIRNSIAVTFIVLVSPHKIIRTLEDINNTLGNIEVVLAHELTKLHQSIQKQTINNLLVFFQKQQPKGEYILLFSLGQENS